jgi:membrane protein DedA with SNARE-associated domain
VNLKECKAASFTNAASDVFVLDFKGMHDLLLRLNALSHWHIDLIALGLLLQGAFLAILPEEVILVTLGFLAAGHKTSWLEAGVVALLGLLPANVTAVIIGRVLGVKVFHIAPFRWFLKRSTVEKAQKTLYKHSKLTVFITRFIPSVRGPVYLAVGLSGMRVLTFMQFDALASCIHIPILFAIGAYLHSIS